MEQIKLSNELLKRIKIIIDREQNNDKKSVGFSQLAQWYATEHISISQATQIISFYNGYNKNTAENKEDKKRVYEELKILPFCKNWVNHNKRLQATKRNITQHTRTNRTIDRMNTINTTPTKPITPPKTEDLREDLKLKKYKITYTANKTRYITDLHLYSASETQAIEKLKATNYRLKSKHLIILNIILL